MKKKKKENSIGQCNGSHILPTYYALSSKLHEKIINFHKKIMVLRDNTFFSLLNDTKIYNIYSNVHGNA